MLFSLYKSSCVDGIDVEKLQVGWKAGAWLARWCGEDDFQPRRKLRYDIVFQTIQSVFYRNRMKLVWVKIRTNNEIRWYFNVGCGNQSSTWPRPNCRGISVYRFGILSFTRHWVESFSCIGWIKRYDDVFLIPVLLVSENNERINRFKLHNYDIKIF